jgi:phage-related holin
MLAWLKSLFLSALAVFAPVQAVLLAVLALVLLDAVTGIWAARKRGEEIRSAGLRRTVSKVLAYEVAIVAGHIVGVYLLAGALPVVSLICGCIALVEGVSILENIQTVTGSNLFKAVIDRLGSVNDKRPE